MLDLLPADEAPDDETFSLLVRLIRQWCDTFSSEQGEYTGLVWNSYVVATRIRAWTMIHWQLRDDQRDEVAKWLPPQLVRHATVLAGNLEWDLRANHLVRDAVGLAYAACAVECEDSEKWLDVAYRLSMEQAEEQVLPDGGHFERSPMYHAETLYDFLQLRQLFANSSRVIDALQSAIERMTDYLAWACHPDGKICLFNDAAHNGMPPADWLLSQAKPDSSQKLTGARLFADTGLMAARLEPWSLHMDVGPISAEYQPGHAHADSLTIEASYNGTRLLVDPGTKCYDRGSDRSHDRGTASHNTVVIDGQDSSEVWDIFRVGRRARTEVETFQSENHTLLIVANHDGYRFLPGRPLHRRTMRLDGDGKLMVFDEVSGAGEHVVSGGWLIEPTWNVKESGPGRWRVSSGSMDLEIAISGDSLSFSTEPQPYHPEYGLQLSAHRLVWRFQGELPVNVELSVRVPAESL